MMYSNGRLITFESTDGLKLKGVSSRRVCECADTLAQIEFAHKA